MLVAIIYSTRTKNKLRNQLNPSCPPCNAGTYSDEIGEEKCKPCLPGTYSNVGGAKKC